MENKDLNQLTVKGIELFDKVSQSYGNLGIAIVMADYAPQRGKILSEFVEQGGEAYMAGGSNGQQFFYNIPQYTLSYDCFNNRTVGLAKSIISCVPKGLLKGRNFATFNYAPIGDRVWSRGLEKQVEGTLVAMSEQNFREYFEEKANLTDILTQAGLKEHLIPSKLIRHNKPLSQLESKVLYENLKSSDGKVVIQTCGEGNVEEGGGHSTIIVKSYEEFNSLVSVDRSSYIKISKFISGSNSNLSICAGNTIPSKTMLGSVKGELLPHESRFTPEVLSSLKERAEDMGINESNIIVNVHPSTLKVVGDPLLTSSETNGVGNQLNYNFKPEVMHQIYDIGKKLGTFMALRGKVGLCGADLIVTKEGNVYINEINDRQQGPTENASLNNESQGLPGIHREAFLMYYADLKNREVREYLQEMDSRSREIFDASSQIPSPFYIKVCALQDSYSKVNLTAGDYKITKDEQNNYTWNLQENLNLQNVPKTDISQDETVARIDTVSAIENEPVDEGIQFLRINGVADSENAPFTIDENGNSILSPEWIEPIKALYNQTLSNTQIQNNTVSENLVDISIK